MADSVDKMNLQELLAEPESTDDLQIPQSILTDIILRLLYNEGNVSFRRFVQVMRVSSPLMKTLDWMRQEHYVEIAQGSALSMIEFNYIYKLTDLGKEHAREALERGHYVGPLPVPVHYYNRAIELQTQAARNVSVEQVKEALNDMVLPDDFHFRVGPAVNSGDSLFLYGPSGNGKTAIALKIARLIAGSSPIYIPYALTAGGQIIQIHDRLFHQPAPEQQGVLRSKYDARWGLFKRPTVVVGGELKMESLDMRFDPVSRMYEAPLQVKANGGMFLIDDFGRQQVSPVDLLNRWIVPLESGVDYLRLNTGQTIVLPFRTLIVFSTNLDPFKLADDAFYRRIQIKVGVLSPDEMRFREIFQRVCQQTGIPFDETGLEYLLETWYHQPGRTLQAVHPRDILSIIQALCAYEKKPVQLTPDLIDKACLSYFVEA